MIVTCSFGALGRGFILLAPPVYRIGIASSGLSSGQQLKSRSTVHSTSQVRSRQIRFAATTTRIIATVTMAPFKRLVRFVPKGSEEKVLLGEPADENIDVGLAVRKGEDVTVHVFSGASVLEPGAPTGETAVIGRVLAPLARKEVGTIRCIGLNVGFPSFLP